MSRAERFEFQIDDLTGGRRLTEDEARETLAKIAANDGRTPLKYEGGYIHTKCGGEAEKAIGVNVSCFCKKCGYVVPSAEVERE